MRPTLTNPSHRRCHRRRPPPATQQPVRIPNPHPADRTFEYV